MNNYELEEGNNLNLDFKKLQKIAQSGAEVLPAVAQDIKTGDVLILGYVNELAFKKAQETGMATFWSTSRNELWIKGKTSGDFLKIKEIRVNCEQNSLLYLVTPQGKGACHTKNEDGIARRGCYYRKILDDNTLDFI